MNNDFKIAWCPYCEQGWVNIVKDMGNNKIVIICSECYTTWAKPSDIKIDKTIQYHFVGAGVRPSIEEINEFGWSNELMKE